MVDTAFVVRNGVVVLGLLVAAVLIAASILLQALPWWVFFLGVLVLPITDPVAKEVTRRLTGEEVEEKRSADAV